MARRSKAPTQELFVPAATAMPLAERMRPRALDEIVGQQRLVAPGRALRRAVESGHLHSMILWGRSEEHTSELQSLMRISYAVFCLKKKKTKKQQKYNQHK